MAKLPRPQAPAIFRSMFPDLADWLESPWTGPPPFLVTQSFRVEETVQDDGYMIRAELPGLDPGKDIEVTVDGRILTIRAERRQEDSGPYRSEFRYGSLTRSVRLPARVDASDVTARYDKGILEVSVPAREAKPEGTRVPIEKADSTQAEAPGRQKPAGGAPPPKLPGTTGRSDLRRRPAAAEACDVPACPDGCAPRVERATGHVTGGSCWAGDSRLQTPPPVPACRLTRPGEDRQPQDAAAGSARDRNRSRAARASHE